MPVAEQSAFATELAAGRLGFRNKRRVLMACPYIGAREEAGVETDVVLSFRECLFGPRCEKPVFTARCLTISTAYPTARLKPNRP